MPRAPRRPWLDPDSWLDYALAAMVGAVLGLSVPTAFLVYRAMFTCGQLTCP